MTFNTVFQVMADKVNRPEILEKADRLLFMPQLLSFMLTGEPAAEYTICSTSAMIDAQTRQWSDELIERLGFPRRIFGKVQMPGTQAGSYNGIPVYLPGGHDTASAVAAVPALDTTKNWAYISSGTWSLIGAELDEPNLSAAAAEANFTNEGGIGGKIRFLKNVNGLWLIQECRRIWKEQGETLSFAEIAAVAEDTSFASRIDPNDLRFQAPENMVLEIQAACRESDQEIPESVGQVARCCYESLAQAYSQQLTALSKLAGTPFDVLHVVGGGCQATLLNQLTANCCGIPVITGPVEATAIGNICVQALANGLFQDLNEARQAIADAFELKTYYPNA